MCVCVCLHLTAHVCGLYMRIVYLVAHMEASLRSGISLTCSPTYVLRQGQSLDLELSDLVPVSSRHAPDSSSVHLK